MPPSHEPTLRDLEVGLMAVPAIRREVEKLRPTISKVSDAVLVALSIVLREEAERRRPAEPVPLGNRRP
jgi:hypothetical protein